MAADDESEDGPEGRAAASDELGAAPASEGADVPLGSDSSAYGASDAQLGVARPGAIPSSEIHEDSVSVFDRSTGDSSRSLVVIVLISTILLLLGVFFLTKAP